MFGPLGPKTLKGGVCWGDEASPLAVGVHIRIGHHGQVSYLPTLAMGASTGPAPGTLRPSPGLSPAWGVEGMQCSWLPVREELPH